MTEQVLTEKMGDLMVSHIHLAHRTRFRVVKGMVEQVLGAGGEF